MTSNNTDASPAYCPTCGADLVECHIEGRSRRYCSSCEKPIYRNPKPCAGVLVTDESDQLLLVKRTQPPDVGAWSLPAGYLEADEPPQQAAVRELQEETAVSVSISDLRLLTTTFVDHPNGSHVLVVIYVASRSTTEGAIHPGSDAANARFWGLPALNASDERIESGYWPIFEQALEETGADEP